jgi:hypothetical protein
MKDRGVKRDACVTLCWPRADLTFNVEVRLPSLGREQLQCQVRTRFPFPKVPFPALLKLLP